MPPQLRADIEALSLPGEKLAATVRRLLSAAVADAQAEQESASCPACGRWHSGWIPEGCPLSDASSPAPEPAQGRGPEPVPEVPAVRLPPAAGELPETGKRVVLASTWRGEPVVIGPVYTAKGAAEIADMISGSSEAQGWSSTGVVRLISRADLAWSWES